MRPCYCGSEVEAVVDRNGKYSVYCLNHYGDGRQALLVLGTPNNHKALTADRSRLVSLVDGKLPGPPGHGIYDCLRRAGMKDHRIRGEWK